LPPKGVASVAVATPGFLTEGLETLEEIGIRGRESFTGAGGKNYLRLPCVETNDLFIKSLAALIVSL
jgi:ferrochelatase